MRLEAELSLCSDTEDVVNGTNGKSTEMERGKVDYSDAYENTEDTGNHQQNGKRNDHEETTRIMGVGGGGGGAGGIRGTGKFTTDRTAMSKLSKTKVNNRYSDVERTSNTEDAESDSSEELQYGPGIVNKLKSKYLNLTLRETSKNRATVQRFRRAASLEDLLDREEVEANEKTTRKYTKRNAACVTGKNDRYRNASRGNDSMKRARSVETLMRYNTSEEASCTRVGSSILTTTNGTGQEPINDHIILIDRTSVKIESRLGELDRPKQLNKPKRIKPVLAETERPPPDLVKTTMRIFEGSAKKFKPKGEVAVKVATFKTINDTVKAQQSQKKVLPKPPIQPKPFVNGNGRGPPGSPKKIVLSRKPTAELIEKQDGQDEYHIDGVITDPIVQSVSSVVSKFQQIEKSHSPSPSPEPSFKLKFSPVPSPEPPQNNKAKLTSSGASSLEINVKSPPMTPTLSPRITSPRLQSPLSPMKDSGMRQISPRVQNPPSPAKESSPTHHQRPQPPGSRDFFRQSSKSDVAGKFPWARNDSKDVTLKEQQTSIEHPRQQVPLEQSRLPSPDRNRNEASLKSSNDGDVDANEEAEFQNENEQAEDGKEPGETDLDDPKTISKSALDNIGRAGSTMQFNFNDKPNYEKSYLPGTKQNGQKSVDEQLQQQQLQMDVRCVVKTPPSSSTLSTSSPDVRGKPTFFPVAPTCGVNTAMDNLEATSRLQERIECDKNERKNDESRDSSSFSSSSSASSLLLAIDGKTSNSTIESNKPIGAICSLGLIKTATSTTPTPFLQSNDSKTIRCQKTTLEPSSMGTMMTTTTTTTLPPQKQIGIIRPLVTTKTQHPQQNLSNRELEKNLINRVKSIEQPTKVVVSLKSSADEIQPSKKTMSNTAGGTGLWDTKPWNQQNNTMVFNFSNRKDVPDYIENDGLIIKRKREKPKVGEGGIIVLDATLDASTTDDTEWEISGGPPSPCDVSFLNDNVLINGRSNLSKTPRNHKHRIKFDDTATRTFEYPSEASMLEGESSNVDSEMSVEPTSITQVSNKTSSVANSATNLPSLLGAGGLASYTPSKVDLTSEGFELGITRAITTAIPASTPAAPNSSSMENTNELDYLKPAQDAGAWGSETIGDLLY